MGFSSWLSHLRSCSKNSFTNLLASYFHTRNTPNPTKNFVNTNKPFMFWSTSLLPITLAISAAGSLAFHPSLCDASNLDPKGVSFGGKGSTEFVVKGSHKEVPQQLIHELKAICHDNMTMDYDERFFHGKPQNSFHKAVNIPDVVVFPRSEKEVSKIVQIL